MPVLSNIRKAETSQSAQFLTLANNLKTKQGDFGSDIYLKGLDGLFDSLSETLCSNFLVIFR